MSKFNKETQKSIRVVVSLELYQSLKDECPEHGDISRIVRRLLDKWLKGDIDIGLYDRPGHDTPDKAGD